jgi:hypothetical protein
MTPPSRSAKGQAVPTQGFEIIERLIAEYRKSSRPHLGAVDESMRAAADPILRRKLGSYGAARSRDRGPGP